MFCQHCVFIVPQGIEGSLRHLRRESVVNKPISNGRVSPEVGADFLSTAKGCFSDFELVEPSSIIYLKYRCTRWATNYIKYKSTVLDVKAPWFLDYSPRVYICTEVLCIRISSHLPISLEKRSRRDPALWILLSKPLQLLLTICLYYCQRVVIISLH